jgi:hypothetical protein
VKSTVFFIVKKLLEVLIEERKKEREKKQQDYDKDVIFIVIYGSYRVEILEMILWQYLEPSYHSMRERVQLHS